MKVNKGYTLIELLVTIAIIAILASLITAVSSLAKNHTKDIHCRNNLRTIGILIHNTAQGTGRLPVYNSSDFLFTLANKNSLHSGILVCKLDNSNYKAEHPNTYTSYVINTNLSGKLIDNRNKLNKDVIASDSLPRHKGFKNAVTLDLRVIKI